LSPGSAGTVKKTFKKPTFRISLDHKFTPDVMAYASYNRGFNAGFFNQAAVTGFRSTFDPAFPFNPPNVAVDPEGIDAYEIGLKTDWFNRRLQINAAAFLYDYTNLQQQIYQFGNLFTLNAASARIKGIDLDIVARPTRDLTVSLSTNYIDSKYLSYPLAPNGVIQPNGELVYLGALNAEGNRLVLAPKYGVQATASYRLRTSIGTFDTTGNMNYQSRMFADPQNRFPVRARTLLGITEQWTSNDGRMTATAWVKNLTNKRYDVAVTLQEHVGLVGLPGSPRTYGLTLGYRY
jgi:iron complex outermembrane receptor protein